MYLSTYLARGNDHVVHSLGESIKYFSASFPCIPMRNLVPPPFVIKMTDEISKSKIEAMQSVASYLILFFFYSIEA